MFRQDKGLRLFYLHFDRVSLVWLDVSSVVDFFVAFLTVILPFCVISCLLVERCVAFVACDIFESVVSALNFPHRNLPYDPFWSHFLGMVMMNFVLLLRVSSPCV